MSEDIGKLFPSMGLVYEALNDLIWNEPRDLVSPIECVLLTKFVANRWYIPTMKCTFPEMGDPNKMFAALTGFSMGEIKRAGGVKCSPLFSTGWFDTQWGVLSLGKKRKEVFFIDPPEFTQDER